MRQLQALNMVENPPIRIAFLQKYNQKMVIMESINCKNEYNLKYVTEIGRYEQLVVQMTRDIPVHPIQDNYDPCSKQDLH